MPAFPDAKGGSQKILPPNLSQESERYQPKPFTGYWVLRLVVLSLLSLEILICQHTGAEQDTELSLRSNQQGWGSFEMGRADPAKEKHSRDKS